MRVEVPLVKGYLVCASDIGDQELRRCNKLRVHAVNRPEPPAGVLLSDMALPNFLPALVKIPGELRVLAEINRASEFVKGINHETPAVSNASLVDVIPHDERDQAALLHLDGLLDDEDAVVPRGHADTHPRSLVCFQSFESILKVAKEC